MSYAKHPRLLIATFLFALVVSALPSPLNAQEQSRTSIWQRLADDASRGGTIDRQGDFEALLLELEGDYGAALERVRPTTVRSADPSRWEDYLRLLARSGQLSELAEAADACEEALYNQRSPVCPLFRGAVEALAGRLEDARRTLELAVDRSHTESVRTLALVNLAEVHLAQGSLDAAARLFRQAARQSDWRASSEAGLAMLSLLRGHYGDALAAMERALEREPDEGFIHSDAVLELVPGYGSALELLASLAIGTSAEAETAIEQWHPPEEGALRSVQAEEISRWYGQCAPELRLIEGLGETCQISALAVAPDGREAVVSCRQDSDGVNGLFRISSLRSDVPVITQFALEVDHAILELAWTSARRVRVATAAQTIHDVLINTNGEGEIVRTQAVQFPNGQLSGYADTLQHALHWDWQNYELSIDALDTQPRETTTEWSIRLTMAPVFARYFEQAELVVVLENGELRAYSTGDSQSMRWTFALAHSYDEDVQMTYDEAADELVFLRDGYLFRVDAQSGELLERRSLRAFLIHRGASASLRTGAVQPLRDGSLLLAVGDTVFIRQPPVGGQRCAL